MTKENESSFCVELKRLRKDLKLTQGELAELAGISTGYVSQLESGFKKPTDRVIIKLCKALEIPENRLFIKIGKMKMDFTTTLSADRNDIPQIVSSLTDGEFNELLNFLAYIGVKSSLDKG